MHFVMMVTSDIMVMVVPWDISIYIYIYIPRSEPHVLSPATTLASNTDAAVETVANWLNCEYCILLTSTALKGKNGSPRGMARHQ